MVDAGAWCSARPSCSRWASSTGPFVRRRRPGRRVVALGVVGRRSHESRRTPSRRSCSVVAVLAEELRPDARETVAFLQAEGVELKVLSGDDPATVASIASDAGSRSASPPLPSRAAAGRLRWSSRPTARRATVIGRISPVGKRRIVESLRDQGYYVAMVGDGVNDVPALKAARLVDRAGLGDADGEGGVRHRPGQRRLRAVPGMVAEGRKILRNIQRVAKLFVTQVRLRGVPDPRDRPDTDRLPTAAASSDVWPRPDRRDPGVLPRARSERRPVAHRRVPARDRPLRGACGGRRGARGDRDLPRHAERVRSGARRGAHGSHVDAGRRRPLPRPRARGARVRGVPPWSGRSARRSGSCTCSCSRSPRRGRSSSSSSPASAPG